LKARSVHGLEKCAVTTLKLTWSKLHSACNKFNPCYWCENLRQTDHVTNGVCESYPVCNQPSLLSATDFYKYSDASC
jgi:hypothetical protein